MEFWGAEVKAGQKLKVDPGFDKVLHLSQAALGVAKKDKGNESVPLFLKVDDQKLVIGTLSTNKCSHITYDLVFEKEFVLSHNWANGSVYFCGYKTDLSQDGDDDDDDSSENESDSEDEEHTPIVFEENGIAEQNDVPSKPSTDNAKSKVKVVEPIKEDTDSDSDESDDEEEEEEDQIKVEEKVKAEDTDSDDDEEDGSEDDSDEEMAGSSDDEDDSLDDEGDDESSDEEDEDTPKKAEQNKKRPAPPAAESDPKTPTGKKAKLVTPQKIGGEGKKTGGHIATPYPSKQAGKTTANKDKSKQQQSPASGGQVTCGSCDRSFKSDQARDAHSKAKHGASK